FRSQFTRISEMISQQAKKIGLDLKVQELERSLGQKRNGANENHIYPWQNDGSEHLYTFPGPFCRSDEPGDGGGLCAGGSQPTGQRGKNRLRKVKEVMEKFKKAFGSSEEE